jgi:hypothetical protein
LYKYDALRNWDIDMGVRELCVTIWLLDPLGASNAPSTQTRTDLVIIGQYVYAIGRSCSFRRYDVKHNISLSSMVSYESIMKGWTPESHTENHITTPVMDDANVNYKPANTILVNQRPDPSPSVPRSVRCNWSQLQVNSLHRTFPKPQCSTHHSGVPSPSLRYLIFTPRTKPTPTPSPNSIIANTSLLKAAAWY